MEMTLFVVVTPFFVNSTIHAYISTRRLMVVVMVAAVCNPVSHFSCMVLIRAIHIHWAQSLNEATRFILSRSFSLAVF